MWLFSVFKDQTIDIIRWDNPSKDALIMKWGQHFDEIKNNSSLIVDPWLAAIFVHNWKIESIQEESWKWSLETDNTPFLSSMKNIMSNFETHDKAQVYFLKTNKITNQKWWTPNSVTYIDPIYSFPVELRSFWNFTFKITNLEYFWTNFITNMDDVSVDYIRMILVDRIIWNITSIFAKKKVSYNEIDAFTVDIAKELMEWTEKEFSDMGLELTDFRIEDINFTEKTQCFIDKITSKSADVWAINKTANISSEAMGNYSQIEKLDIMWKAAESGWAAWDMMWAWIWMAMWMWIAKDMWNGMNQQPVSKVEPTAEEKLVKIKGFFDKWLISEEDYNKKKETILNEM